MNSSCVYLTQTDTTVGFLSSDDKKLTKIKQRKTNQKILQVVDSFKILKQNTRVPKKFRNFIRRSKKTTFIYPNKLSFRVLPKCSDHSNFISKFGKLYSTSANITNKNYDKSFAFDKCDIAIYKNDEFDEKVSSKIYFVNKTKLKRLR
jgi:tRNA A37 threonylcarbamoyladenosine synthetase subunit TsaC/SUA5/YrdC